MVAKAKDDSAAKMEARMQKLVAEAATLNRETKAKHARLEAIKVELRQYATAVDNQRAAEQRGAKIEIESREGVATISFAKDGVSFVKGANPRSVRETLSPTTWDHLFAEEVTLKEDFDDAYKLLSAPDKAVVDALVVWKKPEPRVVLPK